MSMEKKLLAAFNAGFNQGLNFIQGIVNTRIEVHKAKIKELRTPPLIVTAASVDPKREQMERLTMLRNVETQLLEIGALSKNIEGALAQAFPKKETAGDPQ